jgi:tetratricopeptide (TPR) repeat protein
MVRPRFVCASVFVSRLNPSSLALGLSLSVGFALGLGLAFAGCGGDKPPPRSAAAARAPRGGPAPTGGSGTSLSDSALAPAADDALKAEDWPRAEALYRELARRQPRNPAGKRGLGVALMRQDKNVEAVAALEESLQIGDDVRTRLAIASAFAALGRYPSALPHLRKAVKMAPEDPAAWTQLVDALVNVERPESAAEALTESRKSCPACAKNTGWSHATDQVAEALAAKAEKQIAANDPTGARKSVDAATALRPDLSAAHLVLGKLARAAGDTKTAANEYRKAMEALPDAKTDAGTAARLDLAELLLGAGDGAEAVKWSREVVAARDDQPRGLDVLGRACDATRDTDCARKAYDKLTKLPPDAAGASKDALEHARRRMKELSKSKPKSRRRH